MLKIPLGAPACTASKIARLYGWIYITRGCKPAPRYLHTLIMPPNRSTTAGNILEYTIVAANALQDVAVAAQIPFMSRICTLALKIVPMAQV
jgi:hypothetical protein